MDSNNMSEKKFEAITSRLAAQLLDFTMQKWNLDFTNASIKLMETRTYRELYTEKSRFYCFTINHLKAMLEHEWAGDMDSWYKEAMFI